MVLVLPFGTVFVSSNSMVGALLVRRPIGSCHACNVRFSPFTHSSFLFINTLHNEETTIQGVPWSWYYHLGRCLYPQTLWLEHSLSAGQLEAVTLATCGSHRSHIHLSFSSTPFTMKKSLFTLLTMYLVFICVLCVVCLSSCSSSSHTSAYNPMFGNHQHPVCAAYD